jgi:thioredoxin reductase (NADPH)
LAAGPTAAIYAARFHLAVQVIDAGDSRALQNPCTHNHAGFPEGIPGIELLKRMRTQAVKYGAAKVHDLGKKGFVARTNAD